MKVGRPGTPSTPGNNRGQSFMRLRLAHREPKCPNSSRTDGHFGGRYWLRRVCWAMLDHHARARRGFPPSPARLRPQATEPYLPSWATPGGWLFFGAFPDFSWIREITGIISLLVNTAVGVCADTEDEPAR